MQPLAQSLCGHLDSAHARAKNPPAGPESLAIFWSAIALRRYSVTVFFGFRALDFLAGLSRSAPSIDGPHAKLVLAHIRGNLFNVRGHHHRHAGLQPGQAPPFSQMGAQPAFLLPTGIYGHL